MTSWKQVRATLTAAAVLVGTVALFPAVADAHGRGGFHGGGRVIVGGHFNPYFGLDYGWGPFWSSYWGPYWGYPYGPYAYGPRESVDMNAAMIAGYGAIDLNVKPNRAEVRVDGKYVGEARDLDGSPSYLWLKDGTHRLTISKGGYATFDTKIDVLRGIKKGLKIQLQEGPAEQPSGELRESS